MTADTFDLERWNLGSGVRLQLDDGWGVGRYGEGRLDFVAQGPGRGQWRFAPAHAPSADGLPADAWIGFQRTRTRDVSTRDDVRPFSVDEQRRVLAVGACLTCHDGASRLMQGLLRGERRSDGPVSPKCRVPVWEASEPAR